MSTSFSTVVNPTSIKAKNSPKKDEKSLYVIIDYPDQRKRFTVSLIDDKNIKLKTLVILLPKNPTFRGFLDQVLTKFELEHSKRDRIRIKTEDGRRITSLSKTYNNQIVHVSFSNLDHDDLVLEENDEDQQQQQQQNPQQQPQLESPNVQSPKPINPLLVESFNNNNQFIKECLQLKQLYKEKVMIGESYPYRVRLAITDLKRDKLIYLYFNQSTNNSNQQFEYNIETKDQSIKSKLLDQIQSSTSSSSSIIKITDIFYSSYNKIYPDQTPYKIQLLEEDFLRIFPTQYQVVHTIPRTEFLLNCYQMVDKVSELYNITSGLARKLLFDTKWSLKYLKQKSMEEPIENMVHGCSDLSKYKFKNLEPTSDDIECPICLCEYPANETIELICGTRFCNECFATFINHSIQDGNGTLSPIRCPNRECKDHFIDEVTVETTALGTSEKMTNRFISDSVLITRSNWCPKVSCGRIFYPGNVKNVIPFIPCNCNTIMCMSCGKNQVHWPCPCTKSQNDLADLAWIYGNTTLCPRCKWPIQKNQGCDHMTCSKCHNSFCYRCGGNYNGHSSSDCTSSAKNKRFISHLGLKSDAVEHLINGRVHFNNQLYTEIYNNILETVAYKSFRNANEKELLEGLQSIIKTLCAYQTTSQKSNPIDSMQWKSFYHKARGVTNKLLKMDDKKKNYSFQSRFASPHRSLMCQLILNGKSQDSLNNILVHSDFNQFKSEISSLLKIGNESSKIRLFNIYGGQIKSSLEILHFERIVVIPNLVDEFIDPLLVQQDSSSSSEEESDKEQQYHSNNYYKSNKKYLKKLKEQENHEKDQKKKWELKQIEIITQTFNHFKEFDPTLEFDQVFKICYDSFDIADSCHKFSEFLNENQKEILPIEQEEEALFKREQLLELYPYHPEDIIDKALLDSDGDLNQCKLILDNMNFESDDSDSYDDLRDHLSSEEEEFESHVLSSKATFGLSPDMAENDRRSKLSFSTSSISDLLDKQDEFKKRNISSGINDEEIFDFNRNKRMKVSRLLCNEEMSHENGQHQQQHKNSDEEASDGAFDPEDENSCPDSLDSNDANSPEGDEYGSEGESLQIDEDMNKMIPRKPSLNNSSSNIDLSNSTPGSKSNAASQQKVSPNSAANSVNSLAPSPKQLMTIREKMLEYIQKNPSPNRPSCIQVCQQPTSKVVWKNRRLDTPFKLKIDLKAASAIASQNLTTSNIISIGIVTDHKGKLQIDSVENFTEPFNAQGISVFQGLKMTKGTWGKEWNLTFIVLVRPNNASYNNPIILSVSQPFSIVVKTRKNPQIRHNNYSTHILNSASENSSSSPEASPTMVPRRGRLPSAAPLMALSNSTGNINTSSNNNNSVRFPQDDMASLLWAAEIKQKEQPDGEPETIQPLSPKNKYHGMMLNTPKPVTTR
eukprot:gene8349-10255_t